MIRKKGKYRNIIILFIIIVFSLISLKLFILYTESTKKTTTVQKIKPSPVERPPAKKEEKEVARKIIQPPEKVISKIAIIIDDVGYNSENIDDFLSFNGKLTFAVLPFLENSEKYATEIKNRGFEVMIHIPMDPVDNKNHNPGPGAILRDDSAETINYKLSRMIDNVPFAKGANNHMGSYITANETQIKTVLMYLQKNNFYFVDSLTTPDSKAYKIGKSLGMDTIKRDVFIDNKDDYKEVYSQIQKLKRIAKKRGYAVGIGHIHKRSTVEVLKDILPELKRESFELVFVSELMKDQHR